VRNIRALFFFLLLVLLMATTKVEVESLTAIQEPLKGEKTVEIIAQIYEFLGPRLGCEFVESNVILTIAGARGAAGLRYYYPESDDYNKLQALNEIVKQWNIRIKTSGDDEKNKMGVRIDNLYGYELIIRQTKIHFIKPFNASEGWDGFDAWDNAMRELIESQKDRKKQVELDNAYQGVIFGYPDLAIADFQQWIFTDNRMYMAKSDIPYSHLYNCAEPNFEYFPEHEKDPAIRDTIKKWGTILTDFYQSSWHLKLAKDPAFQEARLHNKINDDRYFQKRQVERQQKKKKN